MNGKVVKCCECKKDVKESEAKKHPYNTKYDYCRKCFNYWFK